MQNMKAQRRLQIRWIGGAPAKSDDLAVVVRKAQADDCGEIELTVNLRFAHLTLVRCHIDANTAAMQIARSIVRSALFACTVAMLAAVV